MKNKICLLLPYAGKFHNYMNLFLHSIYTNKDVLDLCILIPDSSTPELETNINFKLPENVFIKKVNFIEALDIFEDKLSEIFQTKVSLQDEQFSFIKNPQNFCYYKGFFNVWCKDLLKEYSHWGWCDCDLILGSFKKMLTDALTLDCHACAGHLSFFRNEELPREAFGPICEFSTPLYKLAYDFFVNKTKTGFAGDESWTIRTVTRFFQTQRKESKLVNQQKYNLIIGDIIHHDLNKFVFGDKREFEYIEYLNGSIYAVNSEERTQLLYAHFMKRTKLCNNTISFNKFSNKINCRVCPPLTFRSF